jgi:paraquat-inducible protein B
MGVVLEGMGSTLEPQSPLFVQFERAMTDLSGASRALRDLADYLERNPSALIRGRPGGDQ